jgi:SAM-dependent methyltransferase
MNLEHIHILRDRELACIVDLIAQFGPSKPSLDMLDVGAGSGRQAARLAELGHRVSAVDVETSAYAQETFFPVTVYDGRILPFPDDSFDVVVSSNVLEHVSGLDGLLGEISRVLRVDGVAVHVLPTPTWRMWTTAAHGPWVLKRSWQVLSGARPRQRQTGGDSPEHASRRNSVLSIFPSRHGERGNLLSEARYFSSRWWNGAFRRNGWNVVHETPIGMFYTGAMLLASKLSVDARQLLARALGSSTRAYVVMPGRRGRKQKNIEFP